jgi:hypothetical protein
VLIEELASTRHGNKSRRRGGALGKVEFLQQKIIPSNEEGWEQPSTLQVRPNHCKLLVQATNKVEDQCAILHRFAKVAEGISHTLETTTVVCNTEITLREVPEFGV